MISIVLAAANILCAVNGIDALVPWNAGAAGLLVGYLAAELRYTGKIGWL